MKNVENRYCYFKEVLAYFDGENIKLFYGISEGYLSREKREIDINKKWSDLWSVFIPFNYTKTLAEMTEDELKQYLDTADNAIKKFNDIGYHVVEAEQNFCLIKSSVGDGMIALESRNLNEKNNEKQNIFSNNNNDYMYKWNIICSNNV